MGERGTWLVKNATIWAWPGGTVTTPDVARATNRQVFTTEGEVRIDEPVPPDRFDLRFPTGTWIGDASRGGRTSAFLTRPARGTQELFDRLPPPDPEPARAAKRPVAWWPFGVWNLTLLGLCGVFWNRLISWED